jgi:hypothetical protein
MTGTATLASPGREALILTIDCSTGHLPQVSGDSYTDPIDALNRAASCFGPDPQSGINPNAGPRFLGLEDPLLIANGEFFVTESRN